MKFTTREELKQELSKCAKNVKYFIRQHVKISTEEDGIIPFSLWDFQEEILDNYQQYKMNIILKARQMGISEVTAAYVAHLIVFQRDRHVYFVATKVYTASNLLRKVKQILDRLPSFIFDSLKIKYVKNNETEIRLSNGSFVVAAATSGDVGRSESLSLLVVDEAAFVADMDKLWKGLKPTMACVAGSTLVPTQHGLQPISRLYQGNKLATLDKPTGEYKDITDVQVWGRNGLEPATSAFLTPERECLKVTTTSGYSLIMTKDHYLHIYPKGMDEETKTPAENFEVGDRLQIYRGTQSFAENNDFFVKTGRIGISRMKKNKLYYLALNSLESKITPFGKRRKISWLRLAKTLKGKLRNGMLMSFPKLIFQMPKDYQVEFLTGLFSHGSLFFQDNIILRHKYVKLLQGLQHCLLNFGIISKIEKHKKGKNRLIIDKQYLGIFKKQIGMRNSVRSFLLDELIEKHKDIQKTDIFESVLEEIVEIKPIKTVTYDLTVPGTHTFVQNGILGSNTGGRSIVISTPNGAGENWFYRQWVAAEKKESTFHPFKLLWDRHPKRDAAWLEQEAKDLSEKEINQEYGCSFIGSGDTVVNAEKLHYYDEMSCEPIMTVGQDGGVWVWEEPIPGEDYLVTVDTARGDGADNQAFQITKISSIKVVAEYRGELKREYFAETIAEFAHDYNTALVAVENNTYGYAVLEDLRDKIQYPNIFYSKREADGHIDHVPALIGEHDSEARIGIHTNVNTREYYFNAWEKWIEKGKFVCFSERWVSELSTFIWKNGKRQAQKGSNDDLIMCSAMSAYIIDRFFGDNVKEIGVQTETFSGIMKSQRFLQTTIPGQLGHRPTKESISDRYKESEQFFFPIIKG